MSTSRTFFALIGDTSGDDDDVLVEDVGEEEPIGDNRVAVDDVAHAVVVTAAATSASHRRSTCFLNVLEVGEEMGDNDAGEVVVTVVDLNNIIFRSI